MTGHEPDRDPVAQKSRALFEHASERLDQATANRLRLARRETLAAPARPRRFLPLATAAAFLAIGVAWWLPRDPGLPGPDPAVMVSGEAAWLSDEDSDLYAWLGEAPVAPDEDKADTL